MKKKPTYTVETNGLAIGYLSKKAPVVIAEKIDFAIQTGELVAIVGSNGIGKSTLLRTLSKIQPALSGTVSINGEPLKEIDSSQLAKNISLVLTEPLVSKNMTVSEIIALGRQPYTNWVGTLSKLDVAKIKEVLQLINLEEIAHKKCYELSDGQLQRVMIARALAQDTQIMLLDEPTTHLDLHHKVHILKLLQRITEQTGKTIVFTSHEIELAIQLCDKMLLMTQHQCIFESPDNLIASGGFDSLFPPDTITFNRHTRTFQINE